MSIAQPAHHQDHPLVIALTGDNVALGPPHRGILPLMAKWDNDVALSLLAGDPARPRTPEASEAEYESYSKGERGDWALFILYERATLRPIGIAELTGINLAHRTADYGIRIGESDCWGKGYGTEATALMLDYAFSALGLHNVMRCSACMASTSGRSAPISERASGSSGAAVKPTASAAASTTKSSWTASRPTSTARWPRSWTCPSAASEEPCHGM